MQIHVIKCGVRTDRLSDHCHREMRVTGPFDDVASYIALVVVESLLGRMSQPLDLCSRMRSLLARKCQCCIGLDSPNRWRYYHTSTTITALKFRSEPANSSSPGCEKLEYSTWWSKTVHFMLYISPNDCFAVNLSWLKPSRQDECVCRTYQGDQRRCRNDRVDN